MKQRLLRGELVCFRWYLTVHRPSDCPEGVPQSSSLKERYNVNVHMIPSPLLQQQYIPLFTWKDMYMQWHMVVRLQLFN